MDVNGYIMGVKRLKENIMKKLSFFACSALAAFMFAACGEDSSVTGPVVAEVSSSSVVESSSDAALSSARVESSSAVVESSSSEIVPQSSATVSSSSTPVASSSSVKPASSSSFPKESSSSVAPPGPTHHIITDATAQCSTRGYATDPMLDGSTPVQKIRPKDNTLPPMASRYVATERTAFTLENIYFSCDVSIDTLDVYVINETVYVKAKMNYDNAKRCLCESKVSFVVDSDPAFSRARLLVLDDGSSINLQNKMEIYDIDVITIDEIKPRQTAKNVSVDCKNDRLTAVMDDLSNASALKVVVDTNYTESFATMVDNGNGYVTISLNNMALGCGLQTLELEVVVSEGVMHVNPKNALSMYAMNCLCISRVSFKIEKDPRFTEASSVVFDDGYPIPIKNKIL